MATYKPGAYGLDEEDPLGLKDYIAGESVPEVQERVLSARLAEMRQPSKLQGAEFDAWMQERAQQARADRNNEGYPSGGIEMRQRGPEDADEAWKGREGPVPTRYSKFATQPPVTGSVPSERERLAAGKAPMPARQLQQMVTGAAMPPRRPASSPSEPDAELSPEMADLVENVGKSAEDVAGKALARRPMTVTVGKPVITERVPMDPPAPTAARPGSVPGRVASAVTGGAPGELRSLLASLKGSPAAPSDVEGLGAAQRRDASQKGLGRVSDALYGAFTRTAPTFRDRDENAAGELLTRRAAGDAQTAREQRAQENDPASEASKAWQDTIRATLPGMAEQLGDSLGRLSAARARELFPRLERMVERKAAADAAKSGAEAKLAAEKDRRAWEGGESEKDRKSRERAAFAANTRRDAAAEAKKTAAQIEAEAAMRKEFSGLQSTKDFQQVSAAYGKILAAAKDPSGAGDLSLIFGFMKIVDPGSTVREGEFANAQNSGGVSDQIRAAYNKAISGERLSPNMRADFVNQARKLYGSQKAQFDPLAEQYRGHAKRAGIEPEAVIPDLAVSEGGEASGAASTPAGAPPPVQTVTVTRKSDGKRKQVPADAADKYRQDPAFEVL